MVVLRLAARLSNSEWRCFRPERTQPRRRAAGRVKGKFESNWKVGERRRSVRGEIGGSSAWAAATSRLSLPAVETRTGKTTGNEMREREMIVARRQDR